jgi:hypothetical protein
MAAPAVRAAGGRAKTPFRWRARRHGVVRSAADAEAVEFRSMIIKLSSKPKPQSVALPIIRTDTKVKRSMCSDPAVAALTFRWDRRGAQLSPEWGRPDAAVQARGAPVHAMRGGHWRAAEPGRGARTLANRRAQVWKDLRRQRVRSRWSPADPMVSSGKPTSVWLRSVEAGALTRIRYVTASSFWRLHLVSIRAAE